MKCIAVIPARGGSKGIPRKNLQLLASRPLVSHSIMSALKTPSIERVFVSTDDDEIADVAREYGGEVILRPGDISGDAASSESAIMHTLEVLQQSEGYQPDVIVFLQCTSPLTLAEDIEGTIQALVQQDADSALSVAPFHYFLWGYSADQEVVAINHDKNHRPRRQDRDPQFVETGAVYAMRAGGFVKAHHRFFGKIAMYHMPVERRLEIDDLVDLQIAEVLLKHQSDSSA